MGNKRILIIRHAKSSWEDVELPDIVRPLNARGKQASNLMGDHLAKMQLKPELIISSPATRAFHTAITIAQKIGYRIKNIDVRPSIYFGGEGAYLEAIKELDDEIDTIYLFGHEPNCSSVSEYLAGEEINKFPTGACFSIRMNVNSWKETVALCGTKELFLLPRELS